MIDDSRRLLFDTYEAAIEGVSPRRLLAAALGRNALPLRAPAILAVGKASIGMAGEAAIWVDQRFDDRPDGLVITHTDPIPISGFTVLQGDHPVPGPGSSVAVGAIDRWIDHLPAACPVWVLISGGTSALIGAPRQPLAPELLDRTWNALLDAGAPIEAMNLVRRRLTLWGGGRLAIALQDHPTTAWLISDVPSNDLRFIGSGPLIGTDTDQAELEQLIADGDLLSRLPGEIAPLLLEPPVTAPEVAHHIVADGMTAVRAAAGWAGRFMPVTIHDAPLLGEATAVGQSLGELLGGADIISAGMHCWRGETGVTLPQDHGIGGRCQQLVLAASEVLAKSSRRVTLLAAGTDGRDGPGDVAGAIVDAQSWPAMVARGLDPASHLQSHDAQPALDSIGALVRTGSTGTNVADLVLAIVEG